MRLSVLLSALIGLAASQCYYPNGTKAENYKYRPCDAEDTTFSTCCIPDEGDICLPNGLCSYPDHYDYRAACSDKSWDKCQQVCPSSMFLPGRWEAAGC